MRIVTLAVLLAGCAHVQVGSHSLVEEPWRHASTDVTTRAAFDMKCPADQVSLTVLKTMPCEFDAEGCAAQIGAEGCGERMVYVSAPYVGWVANSDSGQAAK